MKRSLTLIAVAFLSLACLAGQGLLDNSYYKKSLEFRSLAASSFEEGDYDAAAGYASQAAEYARLSDRYVETMLAKAAADTAIAKAENKVTWADSVDARGRYPAAWAQGQAGLAAAKGAYQAEDYVLAKERAEAVLEALKDVVPAPEPVAVAAEPVWPAAYVVRLIPERRDCLWRIAEYPFVYGDPLQWPKIYEANRKSFKDPGNPNLIFPGQVLVIPSLNGEKREGTWDPAVSYPALPKVVK